MTDVNIQLVREFFELNGFHSMTYWQHDRGSRGSDHGLQLFVENTAPDLDPTQNSELGTQNFVLRPGDVGAIQRAIVEVRPWHTDRLYASVIENNAVLFDVGGDESRARARHVFGEADFSTILVISELPNSPEARQRAVDLFRQSSIDHLLEFRLILQKILEKISPYVSYSPSATLQTMRLLKRYDFIRYQQMEFAFHNDAPAPVSGPAIAPLDQPDLPEEELLDDEIVE